LILDSYFHGPGNFVASLQRPFVFSGVIPQETFTASVGVVGDQDKHIFLSPPATDKLGPPPSIAIPFPLPLVTVAFTMLCLVGQKSLLP
jgi:hypothetical protein